MFQKKTKKTKLSTLSMELDMGKKREEKMVSIEGTEIETGLLVYVNMSSYNVFSWKDATIDLTHANTSDAFTRRRLEKDAKRCWNEFYKENETNFYKDRHYLHVEFEGIIQKDKKSVLLEIGCGVVRPLFVAAIPSSQTYTQSTGERILSTSRTRSQSLCLSNRSLR